MSRDETCSPRLEPTHDDGACRSLGSMMVSFPFDAAARTHRVRDTEDRGERNAARCARGGDTVRLEMFDIDSGALGNPFGDAIVDRDGESRREPASATSRGRQRVGHGPVRFDRKADSVGELAMAIEYREVDQMRPLRDGDLSDGEARGDVSPAASDQDDRSRREIADVRARARGGRRKADAHRLGRHTTARNKPGPLRSESCMKRRELRIEGGEDEDVQRHAISRDCTRASFFWCGS